jgi:hypothetical protein
VSRRRGEPIGDGRDRGRSGLGALAAGQVALGGELGGEGGVAGEAQDLELAVGRWPVSTMRRR